MKRKLVRQGSATMTISIPATWVKKFNLDDGDELEIDEEENKLIISTGKEKSDKKIEITVRGMFTKSDLSHLYILGYDEISIIFDDSETLKNINERIPDCIGYEIIDQSEKRVVIKSISSGLDEEFDVILNKVFLLLKEMSGSIADAVSKSDFQRLNQIKEMETLNNKFTSFLLRMLSKKGYKKQNRSLQCYDLIQNLERLGDEYKYLCENIADRKKPVKKELLSVLKEISSYYEMFHSLYLRYDAEKKTELDVKKRELDKKVKEIKETDVVVHHIINFAEKIRNAYGSFLAMNS